jgi:hypothetical protein
MTDKRIEPFRTWRHVVAEWLFRLAFWVLDMENPTLRVNGRRIYGPDQSW